MYMYIPYANREGPDKPVHLESLVKAFYVNIFYSIQRICDSMRATKFVCVEILRPSQPNGVMLDN